MDQEMCIGVEDDDNDYSLEGTPMSAAAYLRQVRESRRNCADVVRIEIDEKTRNDQKSKINWSNQSEEVLRNEETQKHLIPSSEWQISKSEEFRKNREKIEKIRENFKKRIRVDWPPKNDDVAWHQILIEQCIEEGKQFEEQFPNHTGTPPALSLVLSISAATVNELLTFLVEWADSEGLSRPIREWIFSLLLVVQLPLLPDVVSALRDLAKIARRIRRRLDSGRIEEANEFSIFIAIVGHYFQQKDLID